MIDIKIIKKPKDIGSGGTRTVYTAGGSGATSEKAKHALRADHAGYADSAAYADGAGQAARANYADKAGDIADGSIVYDKFLRKDIPDTAQGRITFADGWTANGAALLNNIMKSGNFVSGLQGWQMDALGNGEVESMKIRSFLEVTELLINRLQAQEGDTIFTDNDQIETVDETDQGVSYVLTLKEKWEGYMTAQMYGNILKGIINTLAAKNAGVSDIDDEDCVEEDGSNKYYTSWMRVTATHNTDNTLGVNQIRVVLLGDSDTPAQKNFAPCNLMVIARWGCIDYQAGDAAQYAAEGMGTETAIRNSIKRRQTVFYLSASEGRVVKLTGVNKPILEEGNYGMVFGNIPDFIRSWGAWELLVREHPHLEDRDYLYAQGLIYNDLIHVDIKGAPVPVTVDCGDWVDGSTASGTTTDEYGDTVTLPAIRHGIYFNLGWNPKSQQFERHTVRHNSGTWLCLQNQPVVSGGVSTYYEPKWNSAYWRLIDGNENYSIEIVSTMGDKFRRDHVDTVLQPHIFYGNVDITADITYNNCSWSRETQSGKSAADEAWDTAHRGTVTGTKNLHLTSADIPAGWSSANTAIFTFTAVIDDGRTQQYISNQIII